ncbi:unnamed protein product, partial [Trichobilharzia regenti]
VENNTFLHLIPYVPTDNASSGAEQEGQSDKVVLLLKATGNAPVMKKMKWSVSRKQKIHWVVDFIRKYISCAPSESLFLYVNQCFAPITNELISNCFVF